MTFKRLFTICIVISGLLLSGCGEDPKPVQPAPPHPATSAPAATPAPTPQQPKTTSRTRAWPYLSADEPTRPLAQNLTARNFLLIFDGSGSMAKSDCSGSRSKIDVAKAAVVAWSRSVPAGANLGLYAFHNGGILTLPLSSGNRAAFIEAVEQIEAGGNTPLTRAMQYAFKAFTDQGRRQLGYGEYTIVVVTDGIANHAEQLQQAVDKILGSSPINIYSIGFCIDRQHSLNQPGKTLYRSAANPRQLEKGLQDVLAESETFDERDFSN